MSAPTNVPTVTCLVCGEWREVTPDGRGFPPDIAKRRLAKGCIEAGHKSEPQYRAGFTLMDRRGMAGAFDFSGSPSQEVRGG